MSCSAAVTISPFKLGEAANRFTLPVLVIRQRLWEDSHAYRLRWLQLVCPSTLTPEWLCGGMNHCTLLQRVHNNRSAASREMAELCCFCFFLFLQSDSTVESNPAWWLENMCLLMFGKTPSAPHVGKNKTCCHYRAWQHQWDIFTGLNNDSQWCFAVRS